MRIDEDVAIRFMTSDGLGLIGKYEMGLLMSYKISRSGKNYKIEFPELKRSFEIDVYQIYWINNVMMIHGEWPYSPGVEKINGQWYLTWSEPFICGRIELGMEVIGNNPYLMFDIVMKKSQTPSSSDDDEDDDDEDFEDGGEEVVDTLGRKLKDYFAIHFVTQLNARQRDSLSRELDRKVREIPDSLRWTLDY